MLVASVVAALANARNPALLSQAARPLRWNRAIGRSMPPRLFALPVALVSVLGNYLLWKLCRCAGHATDSAGLLANATQNRADMLSSAAVATGWRR